MTLQQYQLTPQTRRPQELIYGVFRAADAPFVGHQRVVFSLARAVQDHVEARGLGEVIIAPIDVILDAARDLVVQPDVLFVSRARAAIVHDRVYGAPDLVVEVLSPRPRIGRLDERVGWFATYGVRDPSADAGPRAHGATRARRHGLSETGHALFRNAGITQETFECGEAITMTLPKLRVVVGVLVTSMVLFVGVPRAAQTAAQTADRNVRGQLQTTSKAVPGFTIRELGRDRFEITQDGPGGRGSFTALAAVKMDLTVISDVVANQIGGFEYRYQISQSQADEHNVSRLQFRIKPYKLEVTQAPDGWEPKIIKGRCPVRC